MPISVPINKIAPKSCLAMRASLVLFAFASSGLAQEFSPEQIEFYKSTVKPILAEHCYQCHGGGTPDASGHVKVKSNFQIISRDAVLKGGDHGAAVDLKDHAKSLLLMVVSYADEHLKMPPRGKLGEDELKALEQWVQQGLPVSPEDAHTFAKPAEEVHKEKGPDVKWTYEPRKPVAVPAGQPHPVDAFLAEAMQPKGLTFSPPAEKAALIRRATYDLTGLPPSPEQVASFVADTAPDAYDQLVERLLASPHYGEKYGRHWLDLVRYADSNGFERDGLKAHIWRYRQWVLDSLNKDLPYDEFLRHQLAGDEVENPTPESRIATGYWRLMQWDDEPADRKQHMYDVMDDNVRVTSETFLGMSIGCARCHNHKIDPILQKDYFSFMGFMHGLTHFSNNDSIRNVHDVNAPVVQLTNERGRPVRTYPLVMSPERQVAEDDLINELRKQRDKLKPEQLAGEPRVANAGKEIHPTSQTEAVTWDFTEQKPTEDWAMPGYNPTQEGWKTAQGGFGKANTPGTAGVKRSDWSSGQLWLRSYFQLAEIPRALALRIHHDEDAEVYLNGKLVKTLLGHTREYLRVPLGQEAIEALQTGKNVLAIFVKNTVGSQFIDAGLETGYEGLRAWLQGKGKSLLQDKDVARIDHFLNQITELDAASAAATPSQLLAQMAVEHGQKAPKLNLHIRGNPHSEGPEVEPAFPVVFKPAAPVLKPTSKTSGRRIALANWIADPQNPRTARVMVNRLWQWHFGRGLNASSNEFGGQGTGVSHPALLDWLAEEFVRNGWSLKKMHRLLMTSQAYKQASVLDKTTMEKGATADPANLLWWKFEPRRLSSEELRDSVLSTSGVLNLRYGGESFFADMPDEVLQTASSGGRNWPQSKREDLVRRSIYMVSKRSLQHPLMTDFDQADTDNPCPSRFTTTVPTQALNMLNSAFITQEAANFAKRLMKESPNDLAGQIARGLTLVTQLPAKDAEVAELLATEKKLREQHQLSPEQARERLCLIMLNLNAFVYLD